MSNMCGNAVHILKQGQIGLKRFIDRLIVMQVADQVAMNFWEQNIMILKKVICAGFFPV